MRFMCQAHRQKLLQKPSEVLSFWDKWLNQGLGHFAEANWHEASRFFGCSFEAGEWLLEKPEVVEKLNKFTHIDRYMLAGHYLAECIGKQGYHEKELHLLVQIHQRCLCLSKQGVFKHYPLKHNLEISMAMISRYCQNHGKCLAYDLFETETARHIALIQDYLH